MLTNEIKKGMRVRLANGWYGTMADNMKGNTRAVTVEGFETETGSVYAFDIVAVEVNGKLERVQHTPKQLEFKRMVRMFLP